MDPTTTRQMMIGVYNHLQNARYLGSITILVGGFNPSEKLFVKLDHFPR